METIRENLPTRDHIKNSNHIRETETARERRVRLREKRGRQMKERETGRMANTQPHQTKHPISERWMREAADCNSSPPALQISPSPLRSSFFRLSFIFWLANSHFLISHCLSCFYLHHLLSFSFLFASFFLLPAFLLHFMSHFTFKPPPPQCSSSFSLLTFHHFCLRILTLNTAINQKQHRVVFFYSLALSDMQE